MEKLVKQISKEIDEKFKIFFLDEEGKEYLIDWTEPRFENIGFQLRKGSKFNTNAFTYKGKCRLLVVGKKKGEYEERHIFLERKTKHRYYLNAEDFLDNFKTKAKPKPKSKAKPKTKA